MKETNREAERMERDRETERERERERLLPYHDHIG